jgi:hypothetical protein
MFHFFGVFKAVISHEFYPNNYTMKSMLADFEPQKETAQLVSSQRHFNVLLIISLPNMSLKKLPRQKDIS